MSIGLFYQRLPRQTTGQQTVRPCNIVSLSPFPFIAALPAGRCSPPALPAMWLQTPLCTTGLPHRRGDWCAPSAMSPYACIQPFSSLACFKASPSPWKSNLLSSWFILISPYIIVHFGLDYENVMKYDVRWYFISAMFSWTLKTQTSIHSLTLFFLCVILLYTIA